MPLPHPEVPLQASDGIWWLGLVLLETHKNIIQQSCNINVNELQEFTHSECFPQVQPCEHGLGSSR